MSNILIGGTLQANGPFPTVDGNGQKAVNFGTPTASTDLATKGYGDATYPILAGATGGQTLVGGTLTGQILTLRSNSVDTVSPATQIRIIGGLKQDNNGTANETFNLQGGSAGIGLGLRGTAVSLIAGRGSAGSGATPGFRGGSVNNTAGQGGDGTATATAGVGGSEAFIGGAAGANNGGGGNDGGFVLVTGGVPSGAGLPGDVSINSSSHGGQIGAVFISGVGKLTTVGGSVSVAEAATFSSSTTYSALTASTVPYLDASKILTSSAVTPTQLSYLDATSSIQTQLNTKASSTLTSAHLFVGNISNTATDVALSGDATLANTGALTLANSGVTPATYADATHVAQVAFDAKGRATSASAVAITGLAESDIINLVTDLAAKAADSLVLHKAGAESVSGAKTFADATLIQNNSAATFSTTFASVATANRVWTFPDATDTAMGLAAIQTVTGIKQFQAGKLAQFNGANTFGTLFASAVTANRTITFPDATDTVAIIGTAQSWTGVPTFTAGAITGSITRGNAGTGVLWTDANTTTVTIGAAANTSTTVRGTAMTVNGTSSLSLQRNAVTKISINSSDNLSADVTGTITIGGSNATSIFSGNNSTVTQYNMLSQGGVLINAQTNAVQIQQGSSNIINISSTKDVTITSNVTTFAVGSGATNISTDSSNNLTAGTTTTTSVFRGSSWGIASGATTVVSADSSGNLTAGNAATTAVLQGSSWIIKTGSTSVVSSDSSANGTFGAAAKTARVTGSLVNIDSSGNAQINTGSASFSILLQEGGSTYATIKGSSLAFSSGSAYSITTTNGLTVGNSGVSHNLAGTLGVPDGSNKRMGIATLTGGTVTVNNTSITASTRVFLSDQGGGVLANIGSVSLGTVVAGTSFVINSSNVLDSSVVAWLLIEPV